MSDFVDQFGGDQTSDSEVTSSDESDLEEEIEDSTQSEDEEVEFDPLSGPWTHIIGDDQQPQRVDFTSHPGPKIHLPDTAKPVDYFRLFISSRFIELLVTETNRYADQWVQDNQAYLARFKKSRVHQWIKEGHTTAAEMNAFISVVINMGLIKKSRQEFYWDVCNRSQSTPWFVERFNRDRFQILNKFLHFADNSQQAENPDKLYKVQQVVDLLRNSFKKHYTPHENVSIDESMIGYRGRTPHLRQYMPNKHHARFGIKLWCVCDASSHYTSYFEIYKGAHNEQDRGTEEGVTHALVMRLLRENGLLNRGHHIGLDNYFSSPRLFFDLFAQQTLATGTVRANRKGLPKQLLATKLNSQEICERRKGSLLCVAYKDHGKRPVLLSTKATAGYTNTTNSRGKQLQRPKCVVLYNKCMGGVDTSDARLYAYLKERKTLKWTHKVVFALIGRALLNAYVLYNEHTSIRPKISRHQFHIEVLESLMGSYGPCKLPRKRRSKTEIAQAQAEPDEAPGPSQPPEHEYALPELGCKLVKIGNGLRRRCQYKHPVSERSTWECSRCKVTLCAGCFVPYHKDKNLM